MSDATWIDRREDLGPLASSLHGHAAIGIDTEFLRERTFFPRLCLLQIAAAGKVYCVDTLQDGLELLVPALTAAQPRKLIHAARQDLEALYLTTHCIVTPVFDTQIAAGCIGLKPQIGYADLVAQLLGVVLPKGQTRTDWSKRPLSAAQLEYAADDVLYLEAIADRLTARLRDLHREHWALEDCAALAEPRLYDPEPALAWERLKGLAQLEPAPRARAKHLAVWRERLARQRDLPRSWILPDPALFAVAHVNPANRAALASVHALPSNFNEGFAAGLLSALEEAAATPLEDEEPSHDGRPTAAQKALTERLAQIVDARATELGVSAELLAPRGELKALALGRRTSHALQGWRRQEIGDALLAALG